MGLSKKVFLYLCFLGQHEAVSGRPPSFGPNEQFVVIFPYRSFGRMHSPVSEAFKKTSNTQIFFTKIKTNEFFSLVFSSNIYLPPIAIFLT